MLTAAGSFTITVPRDRVDGWLCNAGCRLVWR